MATLIGKFPDGQYGLRVGVPGYNILSNPVDDAQLYFSSEWPTTMYVHHQQLVNVPAAPAWNIAYANYYNYTNGALPYTPYVMVDVKHSASSLGGTPTPAGSVMIWRDDLLTGGSLVGGVAGSLIVQAYKTRFMALSRRAVTIGVTVFARTAES
jgi:hypothetical protein